jgi:hypothetical protein
VANVQYLQCAILEAKADFQCVLNRKFVITHKKSP